MSMSEFLPYDRNSLVVRPLAELPTLHVADPARDVRGWEVHGHDGRPLGTVVDLLVDIDRLTADRLLVSLAGSGHAGGVAAVPLDRLSPERGSHRVLVAGEGMPPIAIRYQSTTRYAVWGAVVAAIAAVAAWLLGWIG